MGSHTIWSRRSAGADGTRDDGVGIITEELYATRRRSGTVRGLPIITFWFSQKERSTINLHSHNRAEIPHFARAKRLGIPLTRRARVGNCQHNRNDLKGHQRTRTNLAQRSCQRA